MKFNPALALGLIGLALSTPPLMAEDKHHHAETSHEAHPDHMLEGYAVVSAALYKDDLAAAQKAATGMAKHDKDNAMAKHAQAIAGSKSLEDARKHFAELSEIAIAVAKTKKTMHVAHCPMALDGEGANWLQASEKEIQNPYMGTKMPHCGKFMK